MQVLWASKLLSNLEKVRGWKHWNAILDRTYAFYYRARRQTPSAVVRKKLAPASGIIIIICRGNVCRSAFLANYLRTIVYPQDRFTFLSAGLRTRDGSLAPPDALLCAADYGIDLTSHRGKAITVMDVQEAALVVGMEPIHHIEFFLRYFKWRRKFLLLRALEDRPLSVTVPDPFEKGPETFQDCFRILVENGNALMIALQAFGERHV